METGDAAGLIAGAPLVAALIAMLKPLIIDRLRVPHEVIPPSAVALGIGYVALAAQAGDLDVEGVAAIILAGIGVGIGAVGTRETIATARESGDGDRG